MEFFGKLSTGTKLTLAGLVVGVGLVASGVGGYYCGSEIGIGEGYSRGFSTGVQVGKIEERDRIMNSTPLEGSFSIEEVVDGVPGEFTVEPSR